MTKKKMAYLTEEERQMPNETALLQLVLGLQYCKTKEDAKDLLKEAQKLHTDKILTKLDSLTDFMEGKQRDNSIYNFSVEELHNFWLGRIELVKQYVEGLDGN